MLSVQACSLLRDTAASDGNSLALSERGRIRILCLMENSSPNNMVRNYLASRRYIFCFLFFEIDCRGQGYNLFFPRTLEYEPGIVFISLVQLLKFLFSMVRV